MTRVVIERRVNAYARPITRKARLVEVTRRCVVLDVDGQRAWFELESGEGMRGAVGNPSLKSRRASDWTGWRLRYSDWDRLYSQHGSERTYGGPWSAED